MFTKKHHNIVIQQSIAGNITEITTKQEEKKQGRKTIAADALNVLRLMAHIATVAIYIQEGITRATQALNDKFGRRKASAMFVATK